MGCFTVLRGRKKKHELYVMKKNDTTRIESTSIKLPEPDTPGPSLQSAPPSFRNRTEPLLQLSSRGNSRARALSAPSSLDQDSLASMELDNPLPLPLPSPKGMFVLRNMGSFKLTNSGSLVQISGPLPLPPLGGNGLRNFTFEEVSGACQQFSADRCVSEGLSSTIYKATFGDDLMSSKKFEATVTVLPSTPQCLKEFVNEVNTIASLQHPQLCKLIGFHAREGSDQRMLVYERLFHGSLDRLLYGRWDGPSIDWSSRVKVALCAAQGLAFLHEEGPFQAMYNGFSASNIQVDKDFSAKLSGYGCVTYYSETENLNTSNLSVETLERGLLTPKSNVWSFGVVLLELLTGRRNLDARNPKEERNNIVKWSKPFLSDDCRLSLIIDPCIKGRVPPIAARRIADIAMQCLHKDPSERPTMRAIVESLKNVQDIKCLSRYPLQEPSAVVGKQMLKSPSYNGIITNTGSQSSSFSSPPPLSVTQPLLAMPRTSVSVLLPPRSSCSNLSLKNNRLTAATARRAMRRPGVEGF